VAGRPRDLGLEPSLEPALLFKKDYRYHSLMLPCAPPRVLMLGQLTLALLLCVAACTPKFERPIITVASIEMQHGNLLQQEFQVKFHIQNPNDRALPVKGLHADLSIGGEAIASGVSNRAFVVPPLGETDGPS